MENLTGGAPPVRPLPCVVPCKLYFDDKLIYARTDQLANSYQSFVNTYCGGNKNTILDTLKDYATLFQQTFKSDFCSTTIPSDFGIERLNIVILSLIHI